VELSDINLSSAGYEPVRPDLHGSTIMPAGCAGACFSARRHISQHPESRDMPEIMPLQPTEAAKWLPQLIVLLQDAVDSGASVGFLAPLAEVDAYHYWIKAFVQLSEKGRIILAAVHDSTIVGSVQLELASMPNASHRAEVQKLLVLRSWRRQGIGLALMTAIEQAARQAGHPFLVLDTRLGDAAEQLYTRMGYTRVGVIPQFALSSTGTLDATVVFSRQLSN
jgi:GNAT superfamily N-acetyltransferase